MSETPIRIPIHSVTDLITNSSTTIYTYSDASADACVEMIDAILLALGQTLKCADLFKVEVGLDDYDGYWALFDWIEDDDDRRPVECPETSAELSDLVDNLNGAEKPAWLQKLEAAYLKYEDDRGNRPQNTLKLMPLKPEYAAVGELITKFLYSTTHEVIYDG
jgi:hypothetical protein